MILKSIPLTSIEKDIIKITYQDNENTLNAPVEWRTILLCSIIILIAIGLYTIVQSVAWIFFIVIFICLLIVYEAVISHHSTRKQPYLDLRQKITPLLELESVDVYECSCEKALYLFEEDGGLYLLEVAPDKTLAYSDWDHSMRGLLPNSKFSFFVNKNVQEVLGAGIKIYGDRFVPFKMEQFRFQSFYKLNLIPQHLEILDCSIETYLGKIKEALN